ncbi:MAG: Lpg1974 family pore-forming outer membrane protein, partial [Thiotrichales bacterium]|nr:Lpg1974 family pore-forming outer membrane protein [Thiotrichales bacterium]
MILELKKDQLRLKQEAEQARAEANQAQRELEVTKALLEETQQELKSTDAKILRTEEAVAKTQEGLEQAQAEMGTGPSSSVMRIRKSESGPYASVDFIYKRPENDRLTYALLTDDTTNAQESTAIEVDTEYEAGFRIGGGYHFNRGTEGFVQFSYLDTSASDSTIAPAGILDLNPVLVPEEDLDFDRDEDLDVSASASYDMDYRVLDAGFAQNLSIGDQLDLRLGGGIRYASIDDEL